MEYKFQLLSILLENFIYYELGIDHLCKLNLPQKTNDKITEIISYVDTLEQRRIIHLMSCHHLLKSINLCSDGAGSCNHSQSNSRSCNQISNDNMNWSKQMLNLCSIGAANWRGYHHNYKTEHFCVIYNLILQSIVEDWVFHETRSWIFCHSNSKLYVYYFLPVLTALDNNCQ